jgi:hypothetical protein
MKAILAQRVHVTRGGYPGRARGAGDEARVLAAGEERPRLNVGRMSFSRGKEEDRA